MSYDKLVKQFSIDAGRDYSIIRILNSNEVNKLTKTVVEVLCELNVAKTLVDQSDAMCDLIYYVLDGASATGLDLGPILNIVDYHNRQKNKIVKKSDVNDDIVMEIDYQKRLKKTKARTPHKDDGRCFT